MNKILFITTSPRANGNGDTLVDTALNAAKSVGAETARIDTRKLNINPCKACNACMKTGTCIQKDDFAEVFAAMKDSDSIVISAPIYMNLPCSQSITLLNRLFNVFSPEYKGSGKSKKLAVMLTFGGSDPEKMKELVANTVGFFAPVGDGALGSSFLTEYRIETFPQVEATLKDNSSAYLEKATEVGKWAAE